MWPQLLNEEKSSFPIGPCLLVAFTFKGNCSPNILRSQVLTVICDKTVSYFYT